MLEMHSSISFEMERKTRQGIRISLFELERDVVRSTFCLVRNFEKSQNAIRPSTVVWITSFQLAVPSTGYSLVAEMRVMAYLLKRVCIQTLFSMPKSLPSAPRTFVEVLSILILILVSSNTILQANAQATVQEQAAMSDLLRAYPDLASVPSWETLTEDDEYYGRSWTSDFSNLCSSGDGYDLYGVYCNKGYVVGLRVYVEFHVALWP